MAFPCSESKHVLLPDTEAALLNGVRVVRTIQNGDPVGAFCVASEMPP
jgi:hypothetical protein